MTDYVVKTTDLSKKYKNNLVVNNLNLNIKRGKIYGFIGENGAGKSTTLRMLTGLSKPTSGKINLFGFDSENKISNIRKRIGALVESPAFYPNMSAYENLEACRIQKGIPGKKCTEKVLEFVDLSNCGKKKLKNFSMGMKQKLGLAIALIGNPELLILDEPVNGLDPIGIVQMREKLKKLNKDKNMTIIISSHILGELYQLASCFGIIHRGKLVEELTLKALNKKCRRSLNIKVDNIQKTAVILERKLNTTNFTVLPDKTIALYDYIDNPGKVSSILSKENITIEQILATGENLENYFINLVGGLK
ncbi:ATP-binding cassette domain-containing protein [Clostridium sp. MT-14]|jgi:ABC-2 type transport system ATP-binding protein|uniref:ATP-binding cassette domain-containing protein n=1 Tax=unclassified Clostridium TaxID=2614128 RepID=UPI001239A38B|nr:ATP-binding cassette domain-containing protein [Clostridium sp. HV4-5-A1G]KAA8668875.1 ATP-binding cassette domain-containing protein [Clostridium sp. HV4-5-A1G]CAB1248688.1 putative ABC efflux transporter (ATP-binding protein) [Clostridiaceae bacterium BL-3]